MTHCEVVDVDGEPVRIQVMRPLTDDEREAMVEFVRWLRTEHETYHRTAKGKHPRTECSPLSCGQNRVVDE